MKKLKHVVMPLLFMLVYIASGVFIQKFVTDSIVATLLANLIIIAIGFFYYNTSIGDACLPISRWSVPITGILLVLLWFCISLTSTLFVTSGADLGSYADMTSNQLTIYALMSVLVSPVAEEILFRGILFRHLKSLWSAPVACIVSSLIFGVFHGTWTHVYLGLFCGIFFCIVYEYTGRLSACIAVHAGYNLMSVVVSGIQVPVFLTAPAFLMLFNLIVLVALILVGVTVEARLAERMSQIPGSRKSKQSFARFLRRVVPGYAGAVDLTVRHVCQCFMPDIGVQIFDTVGTRLFIGVVSDMEQSANAPVFNRCLIGKQSFTLLNQDANGSVVYLVFHVL